MPIAGFGAEYPTWLCCAVQSSSDFRLELDPAKFPSIPKEFNMRPHADGVEDAYCFNRQGGGSIGASRTCLMAALVSRKQAGSGISAAAVRPSDVLYGPYRRRGACGPAL